MKAVVVSEAGGPEKLVYQELPTPQVKPGWSLVKVMGFGINHSEIFTRQGLSPSVEFPRILGIEAVGVVKESTDEARLPEGGKVVSIMGEMGRDFDGGYAEYVLLPNEQIYPVTTDLTWEELATIPETYYTAFGSLKMLRVKESDRILVRGGTSGVGIAFLNLVKGRYPNIEIDGTSRNMVKKEMLQKAGFSDVMEDRDGELQTDKKYDKIFELIGPATVKNSFEHILEEGIVCSTGQLGGQWYLEEFDPIFDTKKGYLTGFPSSDVSSAQMNELLDYISKYGIRVKPEKIFSLEETAKAHAYLESSHSFGKVIILN
ncbi:zinc-binding dehydrogenase [Listeria rustica]|uniref:Zinc-binding dehydrogenase n=1 Tax=Listeria rustica TaxID=2713503 RepID=A0A7W1YGJ6_9LIST|nr:zinc-binding dehydrogenase [Listeria rustica]MBA3926703.1 zinc-binding dehydrogenase [Listeria rustica]